MKYSIYDLATGQIVELKECDENQLAVNVGKGRGAIEGHLNPRSKKIDPVTLQVIDIQEVDEAESLKDMAARLRIDRLERASLRSIREWIIKQDKNSDLKAVDDQIADLRKDIKR